MYFGIVSTKSPGHHLHTTQSLLTLTTEISLFGDGQFGL